jgi:hypothetical protein
LVSYVKFYCEIVCVRNWFDSDWFGRIMILTQTVGRLADQRGMYDGRMYLVYNLFHRHMKIRALFNNVCIRYVCLTVIS